MAYYTQRNGNVNPNLPKNLKNFSMPHNRQNIPQPQCLRPVGACGGAVGWKLAA